jgi:NarL family two-component system response regulator LiaR
MPRTGKHPGGMTGAIRVALVNDYEIVLEGLRALLRHYGPDIQVVELDIKTTPAQTVDVSLLDTYGEAVGMRERVQEIASDPANGAIVVFSFSDDVTAANAAIGAGAQGFISKATPALQIVDGIRAAARSERVVLVERSPRGAIAPELSWPGQDIHLTERESELLALLPTGMTNRELAAHLFLSENTIKTQLRGLFSKLDVRNRVQAVAVARTGILGEQRPRRIHADGEQTSPHLNGNPSSNGKPAARR